MKKLHKLLFYLLILFLPVQLGKHFWPDWAMVSGIRIDYLSPTIYLTDLLVIGILVSWGATLKLKHRSFALFKSSTIRGVPSGHLGGEKRKTLLITAFIIIFFLLNILFAQNRPVAFLKILKIIELCLLAFYIKNNLALLHCYIVTLLPVTVIYSSLIAWAQFLNQSSIGGLFWWLGERSFTSATPGIAQVVFNGQLLLRPYATFPHPNVLAGYLAVVIPLLIAQKSKRKAQNHNLKLKTILNTIAVILGMATLFITFSRTGWIIGGAGIVVSFLLSVCGRERRFRGRRWLLIFTLLLCYFVTLLLFRGQLQFASESLELRQELNKVAIKMIKKYPLTGVGLNNFIPSLTQFKKGLSYQELQPVHNIYLLIGAESGLMGLGLFLWLIYLSCRKFLQGNNEITKQRNKKLSIILTAILLLGLFDHYFFTLQQTQLLFAVVMGIVFGVE